MKEVNDVIMGQIISLYRDLDLNELTERIKEAKEALSKEEAIMRMSPQSLGESQSQISLLESIISVGKQLNRR